MTGRIDPKVLADLTESREVYLSPDGNKVVYSIRTLFTRKTENIQSSVWIAEVGKENSATQLTQGGYHDFSPRFSPDGKYVSFLSDRSKPGSAVVLYLLPLAGGEAYPLTDKDHEMGIGNYAWRPDSRVIAYTSADEKSEDRKQKEKDKNDAMVYDENADQAKLRVIDVESKEVKSFDCGKGHAFALAWNCDGTKLACSTTKSPQVNDFLTHNHIYLVDTKANTSEELCFYPSMIQDLCWSDEQLMWSGGIELGSHTTGTGVYAMPATDDKHEFKVIAHGKEDCVAEIKHRDQKVVVQVLQGLEDVLEVLNGVELYRAKQAILAWDIKFRASGEVLVMSTSSVGCPGEIYSVVDGKKTQLSQHGAHIASMNLGKAHLYEYKHEDGTPIDGYYAVPTSLQEAFSKGEPQPTVLVVHGGPYMRVSDRFDIFWQWTAFYMSLGYLVLCPNYRGSSSHGHEHANTVRGDSSASYQDIVWTIKQGIKEGRIDPDRVSITGWSQGGFLSYLAVTRDDQFHFRAAIPGAGVTDWTTMSSTSDLPYVESEISGSHPWELKDINDVERRKSSPLYYTQNIKTPVLIIHGELDRRTPLEQAVGFYRALKAKGKEVELVVYPREEHGFSMPWEQTHFIDMLERMEKFLDKHMK